MGSLMWGFKYMLDLWGRCACGKVQNPVIFLYYCFYYFKASADGVCLGVVFKVLWSRISQGSGLLPSKEEERNIVTIHRGDVIFKLLSFNYLSNYINSVWTLLCPPGMFITAVLLFINYELIIKCLHVEQSPIFILVFLSSFEKLPPSFSHQVLWTKHEYRQSLFGLWVSNGTK